MNYDKTVNDIINTTGLKYDYIRKCLKYFENIFNPYIKRGNNNSILFDSNALIIFDRIKQLKEKGYSLNTIEDYLKNSDNLNTSKPEDQTNTNQTQTIPTDLIIKEIKEAYQQTLIAKDESIQTQKSHIKTLESKILLLTDGKSPEEVKAEQRRKEQELLAEKEKYIKMQLQIQDMERKKIDLINQIQNLEGKWFMSKKRKDLLQQLSDLTYNNKQS